MLLLASHTSVVNWQVLLNTIILAFTSFGALLLSWPIYCLAILLTLGSFKVATYWLLNMLLK
jgi:hypothetical protein